MTKPFQLHQVPDILFAVKPPTNVIHSESSAETGLPFLQSFWLRAQLICRAGAYSKDEVFSSFDFFTRFFRRLGSESVNHSDAVADTSAAGGRSDD